MIWEWVRSLFDPSGFLVSQRLTGWSPLLIWLAKTSNYSMTLSLLSLSGLMLWLYRLTSGRNHLLIPRQKQLFLLFSLFLLWNGLFHLVRAIIFEVPVYRLMVAAGLVTTVLSWATLGIMLPGVLTIHYLWRSELDTDPTERSRELKESLQRGEDELTRIIKRLDGQQLPQERGEDHAS